MPDDLRSRVADTIWKSLKTQHNVVNFHALADAVIRELDAHGWLIDPESGERHQMIASKQ